MKNCLNASEVVELSEIAITHASLKYFEPVLTHQIANAAAGSGESKVRSSECQTLASSAKAYTVQLPNLFFAL
jgi:hypothetical protein